MKHVVMITNDTTFAYNLRKEVIERLVQGGYKVTLISEYLSRVKELSEIGCSVIDVKTGRRGTSMMKDLQLFLRYFRILKDCKPDIVLSNNIKPNVYAGMVCRLLKIRYIPNITGIGTPLETPGPLQKLTTFLYKVGIGGASAVFFQNSANIRFFQERNMMSSKSRIVLLPGSGVNLQRYPLMEYPKDEELHFLYTARVMKEKGIDLFLSAARKYHNDNTCFDVCGNCDDKKYIEILQQAHDAGIITYHGQQKDLNSFYERCSCFLYPSYYPEGMSNVLLEAAATGRPAIAADRPGCREIVDDGVTGYIVPVNDEEAVFQAVENFLNLTWQERRDMGLSARAKVEKEFDREFVVQIYIDEISALNTKKGIYSQV